VGLLEDVLPRRHAGRVVVGADERLLAVPALDVGVDEEHGDAGVDGLLEDRLELLGLGRGDDERVDLLGDGRTDLVDLLLDLGLGGGARERDLDPGRLRAVLDAAGDLEPERRGERLEDDGDGVAVVVPAAVAGAAVPAAGGEEQRPAERGGRERESCASHGCGPFCAAPSVAPTIMATMSWTVWGEGRALPTTRPWRMTTASSHTWTTWSMLCEMRMIEMPCSSGSRRIVSRTLRVSRTPSAAVGSSRMSTRRAKATARATAMACRCPPDMSPTWPRRSGRCTWSVVSRSATSRRIALRSSQPRPRQPRGRVSSWPT